MFQSLLHLFVPAHLKNKFVVPWVNIVWVIGIQHSYLLPSDRCMTTTASLGAGNVSYGETTSQRKLPSRTYWMFLLPIQSSISALKYLLLLIFTFTFVEIALRILLHRHRWQIHSLLAS